MKHLTTITTIALLACVSVAAQQIAPGQAKAAMKLANNASQAGQGKPAASAPSAPTKGGVAAPAKPTASAQPTPKSVVPVKSGPTAPAAKVVAPAKPTSTVKPEVAAKAKKESPNKPKDGIAAKKGEPRTIVGHGERKRDPFQSVIVERPAGTAIECKSGGKKCLVPQQVLLKGIVRGNGSRIAVVVNSQDRAYFLRENDPVFNGVVVRIGTDSITFRENGTDMLGHPTSREVVKKLAPPA